MRPKEDRQGWVAFQYQRTGQETPSLLFVYRLNDGAVRRSFCLENLDRLKEYTVQSEIENDVVRIYQGHDLMDIGISVDLPRPNSHAAFVIKSL